MNIRAVDHGWPYPRSSDLILTLYLNGTQTPSRLWPVVHRERKNEFAPTFVKIYESIEINEDAAIGQVS